MFSFPLVIQYRWNTLATSKPCSDAPPWDFGVINSRLSFASFALSIPKWPAVALFFCVRAISDSMSAIFSKIVDILSCFFLSYHKIFSPKLSRRMGIEIFSRISSKNQLTYNFCKQTEMLKMTIEKKFTEWKMFEKEFIF